MKVFVGVRGEGLTADAYYRCVAPWQVCRWCLQDDENIRIGSPNHDDIDWSDVAIFQRPVTPSSEALMWRAKYSGKLVVMDVDDNLFAIPPSAGALFDHYNQRGSMTYREPIAWFTQMLQLADAVTVTTDALAQGLRKYAPSMAPTITVPNRIRRTDWDALPKFEDPWEGRPVVGWFGFPYYYDALINTLPPLFPVLKKHNAILFIIGMPEIARQLPEEMRDRNHLAFYDVVPFTRFDEIRAMLPRLTVGLLPLANDEFSRCKSPLKALQYGIAGVPCVAHTTVYGEIMKPSHALFADAPEDFASATDLLLEDETLRASTATQWRKEVIQKWTLESVLPSPWPGQTCLPACAEASACLVVRQAGRPARPTAMDWYELCLALWTRTRPHTDSSTSQEPPTTVK